MGKLIVVSNRLPVTLGHNGQEFTFQPSSGGLATGLRSYLGGVDQARLGFDKCVWVGWPGATVAAEEQEVVGETLQRDHGCVPVYLSQQAMDDFYFGLCNKTLWPLFHYFPSYAHYDSDLWGSYVSVNEEFLRTVSQLIEPGDTVWIHDYHLMLLPEMLRARFPDLPIGFFLHIPFPTFEVFRLLPVAWRTAILEGLLGADLVGFHTHDHAEAFLGCVRLLLGIDAVLGRVVLGDRFCRVGTFPMGIDYRLWHGARDLESVKAGTHSLRQSLGDSRLILSIDRLDYSKGILNRLAGFEKFLERNPEQCGSVLMLLVVIPSRVGVEHYDLMKRQLDETVGRINGKFSRPAWAPILYRFSGVPFDELVALYREAEVMLVTPLRDGMNLIAKEFIAVTEPTRGVLILSEMAGAAKELGEAVVINPNDVQAIASAIKSSLDMPAEERRTRNETMQKRSAAFTVFDWADDFLRAVVQQRLDYDKAFPRRLTKSEASDIIRRFCSARRRILFLDYDGTLVGIARDPWAAIPDPQVISMLERLRQLPDTDVVVISGRDRATLGQWFPGDELFLVAEHGTSTRVPGVGWRSVRNSSGKWREPVVGMMEHYQRRLPGSLVEQKEFGVAFHYRNSDQSLAGLRVAELRENLLQLTANVDAHVMLGKKVVEVRPGGADKGQAVRRILKRDAYDFVFAVGDDVTDEDMFQELQGRSDASTVKVGMAASRAAVFVPSHREVRTLLEEILEAGAKVQSMGQQVQ